MIIRRTRSDVSKKNSLLLHGKSIQGRLLVYFILVAILPTIAISVGSILFGYYNARQSVVKQLDSLIALEENKINTWLENGQNELVTTFNETYLLERIQVSINMQNRPAYYDFYREGALFRLNRYLADTRLLKVISVLDLNGVVILSTEKQQEGQNFAAEPFFTQGLQGAVTQIVRSPDLQPGFVIVTAYPVVNSDGQVIGELLGSIKEETLAALLEVPDLPQNTGRVLLTDEQNNIFTASPSSLLLTPGSGETFINVHSAGIDRALAGKDSGFLSYKDEYGRSVYGVRRWIAGLNMALLVEQDQSSVLANIFTNQVINLLIIAAGIGLAVFISLLTARRISTPLAGLAQASVEIASGNFTRTVELDQEDEIGVLAKAFNSMASQLHTLVDSLETRVKDRTGELQESNRELLKRARQMETTSQVSREITSILDIDPLLSHVVQLIEESFSYYHVSIFLLDKTSPRLVWRAGSKQESPQNGTLELLSNSLNSKAAQTNQAVLVNDVRQEPSFLADPDLPETLSELVIPLRMGEQVIGTMDIHHRALNAFSPEDLKVLQGLGDQIAIAINNALLYEKIQALAVLEERNRLSRELHDSVIQSLYSLNLMAGGWQRQLEADRQMDVHQYLQKVRNISEQALREMRLLIHQLRPPVLEEVGFLDALHQRLDAVEKRAGIDARLVVEDMLELPYQLEEPFFWIAQEALNNALKHGSPRTINVWLGVEKNRILLKVRDDGCGFDLEQAQRCGGLGLRTMKERATAIEADLSIQTSPGQGTLVCLAAPLSKAEPTLALD
jgi:nitrate/nitrite-specific signal transduction histidine kinase